MAFHIRNPKVEEALRKLCAITGESLTEAVQKSVEERLANTRAASTYRKNPEELIVKYQTLRAEVSRMEVLDHRSPDEILGYDENGLPT